LTPQVPPYFLGFKFKILCILFKTLTTIVLRRFHHKL
jgi:hypothetical protein